MANIYAQAVNLTDVQQNQINRVEGFQSFDERFMTGVCSTDYATAVEVNEPEQCLVEEMLNKDDI